MAFKDIVTPLILLATIISSHWIVSKQTRKTKKAKWIEDFRSQIANFMALSNLINNKDVLTIHNLSTSSYVILMLLDDKNKRHQLLNDEIVAFGFFSMQFNSNKLDEYNKRIGTIKDLAKQIIVAEERKL